MSFRSLPIQTAGVPIWLCSYPAVSALSVLPSYLGAIWAIQLSGLSGLSSYPAIWLSTYPAIQLAVWLVQISRPSSYLAILLPSRPAIQLSGHLDYLDYSGGARIDFLEHGVIVRSIIIVSGFGLETSSEFSDLLISWRRVNDHGLFT